MGSRISRLGDREVEGRTLAVRDRKGQDLGAMGLDDFVAHLGQEVENRTN
jgi:threonyl-tRNA synthetase